MAFSMATCRKFIYIHDFFLLTLYISMMETWISNHWLIDIYRYNNKEN